MNTHPSISSPPIVLSLLTLLAAVACGQSESPSSVTEGEAPGQNGSANAATPNDDEWASSYSSATCEKSTSVLSRSASTCEPTTAARTFTRAVCSCEDTNVAGFLRTRSFRSGTDAAGTERLGGSVGVNRNYITGGLADVGGDFIVSGPRDTLFGGLLSVGRDLRFRPAFDVAGAVGVGGDVHLQGSLRALGSIGIQGDLHRSPDSRFLGLALVNVAGERYTEEVEVEAPCGCGEGEVLDVAGAVAAAHADNDNASIGLDPHAVDLAIGLGTALTLPSGRFYVHQVGSLGAIQLRIEGKVKLYVGDDFLAGPSFAVTLAPGAELDLFVRDNFALAGAALLGDPRRPAATRIYVGGTGDIAVAGLNAFAGNLYAPSANVLVGGIGKVYGSLFGKNILAAGFLDVGFDEAVLDGVDCHSEPPESEPPTDEPPANEPPEVDVPAEEDPSEDPPAHELPPGEAPTDEVPTNEPPANEPPRGDVPADDVPGDEQPEPTPEEPDPCIGHGVVIPR
jgi:hypothetical protein